MKKIITILGVVLLGITINVSAQQSINAGGGESAGTGHASFSVGQTTYTSQESIIDDATLFQGVQIPFEAYGLNSCATDFNGDGVTNGIDFTIFLGNFGIACAIPTCPTDLNSDGVTNGLDFTFFLGNFGLICN